MGWELIKCCPKSFGEGVNLKPTSRVSIHSLFIDFLGHSNHCFITVSLLAVAIVCLSMSTIICWYVRTKLTPLQRSVIKGRPRNHAHLNINHDDLMSWKYFSCYCPFVSESSTGYRSKEPVTRNLMFCLMCAWINGWIHIGDTGDLRPHEADAKSL